MAEKDIFDLSKSINGHSFTFGWLLDSLRSFDENFKKLHEDLGVKNIVVTNISNGLGFLSYVYRCEIIFVNDRTYSTVLKIPIENEFDENLIRAHKSECEFYEHFGKILKIPIPKVYQTVEWHYKKQEGCIHMEDLSRRGKCITYFEAVNLTQVKCFIQHLARWHKNILTVSELNWRGKYLENATLLGEFIIGDDEFTDDFVKNSKKEDAFLPLLQKYRKFLRNKDYIFYANVEAPKDLKIPKILVHGDIYGGNILWSAKNENEIEAIIDWQVMHEGSPMTDLSCFLALCCDGVVRRQAQEFAIPYYLECLTLEFGGREVPYTLEQLQESFDLLFISHALHTTGMSGFLFKALQEKKRDENLGLMEAFRDFAVLKTLHAWEDVDSLLQGKYKYIYEKFNPK